MNECALVDGRACHTVDINDRGLAYGDGVFETLRVVNRRAVFVDRHLRRLVDGCQRLSIALDVALVLADINTLLSGCDHSSYILKIIITRAGQARGYRPGIAVGCHRIVSITKDSSDYQQQRAAGVNVRVCDTRLTVNPALAGVKHLCRLENVLARAEWSQASITEGLMLDTDGRLIEGTMSNVFLVLSGRLWTPKLHRCGVAGIIRGVICEVLSPECLQRDCILEDVYRADEVFICNSLIGILPVTAIGCHQKNVGAFTLALQRLLASAEKGND
ncbi:aminodeoxychorismate lyase [Oceanicoccus sp. KOV_DT_Chl]|uniref:aminodeoxychorismate lyase n=1 Tax=Oceanicoccus sp. KOV_DT_Chl TaxID=1904639 RepID=UPI000C7CFA8E|nr:aminodeoxychorismate lyase [Oceanicoccus sp. KOV_DT_Chl]